MEGNKHGGFRCASTLILENGHEKNNANFGSCIIRDDGVRPWGRLPERQSSRAMLSRRLTALPLPLKAFFPAEGTKSVPLMVPSAGAPASVTSALHLTDAVLIIIRHCRIFWSCYASKPQRSPSCCRTTSRMKSTEDFRATFCRSRMPGI